MEFVRRGSTQSIPNIVQFGVPHGSVLTALLLWSLFFILHTASCFYFHRRYLLSIKRTLRVILLTEFTEAVNATTLTV